METKTVVLDCGHGGLKNGVYTTGNKKLYKFPNGEIAYEGVINRMFGKIIGNKLKENGYNVKYTVKPSDPRDLSLGYRTRFSNKFKKDSSIFVSIHCNAFNSRANGTEIFTTVGETESDVLATSILNSVKFYCPELKMRYDLTDGDVDKESQFYVLRNTKLFSVLLECLFFDHWESYQLTKDKEFVDRFCTSVVCGIDDYFNNIL